MMNEPIQVIERRFGLMPAKFNRNGQVIQVDAVEECWTEMGYLRRNVFYHFRVRCGQDRYHLSENTASGAWTMRAAA